MSVFPVAIWLAVNAYVFAMYGDDKHRARDGRWRIPEKRLLWGMWLFGGVGAWLGMRTFHHKTRHTVFRMCSLPAAALSIVALILALYA